MSWGDDDNLERGPWQRQQPPDWDEVLKRFKQWFFRGGGTGAFVLGLIVLGLVGVSCFYSIQPGEVGVVQRFGKFVRMATPGLNWKLPAGIEKVTKIRSQYVYTEEFGIRNVMPASRARYSASQEVLGESLMLTGDLNCALVPWVVQYRISDPYQYLFKVRNVRETLRDLSEAIMRQVVGDRSINEVITERLEIANEAKRQLQVALDDAETGLLVVNLELKKTTVPEPVQPSFNEVNQALQEKEKLIYQAREAYNKVIPEARGEAERMIKDAEGYALERVNRAKGDAIRFEQTWRAYSQAKDVTRRRMYLEALAEVVPNLGTKYIIDADQRSLLPLLNVGRAQGGPAQ